LYKLNSAEFSETNHNHICICDDISVLTWFHSVNEWKTYSESSFGWISAKLPLVYFAIRFLHSIHSLYWCCYYILLSQLLSYTQNDMYSVARVCRRVYGLLLIFPSHSALSLVVVGRIVLCKISEFQFLFPSIHNLTQYCLN
jgi:hypothetical protein